MKLRQDRARLPAVPEEPSSAADGGGETTVSDALGGPYGASGNYSLRKRPKRSNKKKRKPRTEGARRRGDGAAAGSARGAGSTALRKRAGARRHAARKVHNKSVHAANGNESTDYEFYIDNVKESFSSAGTETDRRRGDGAAAGSARSAGTMLSDDDVSDYEFYDDEVKNTFGSAEAEAQTDRRAREALGRLEAAAATDVALAADEVLDAARLVLLEDRLARPARGAAVGRAAE